jgi:hypothetical protein
MATSKKPAAKRDALLRQINILGHTRGKLQRQVKALREDLTRRRGEERQLRIDSLKALEVRQWQATDVNVQLTASGEPGFLRVTCRVRGELTEFQNVTTFHILNVCQSLRYVAPETMRSWHQTLRFALEVLDADLPSFRDDVTSKETT